MSHKYFKDAKAMQINIIFNKVKFDLEGQPQSVPKTMWTLSKIFCIFWSKFGDLSSKLWQAHDWRTHGHTQATTIPDGQNWPRVKMISNYQHFHMKIKFDRNIYFSAGKIFYYWSLHKILNLFHLVFTTCNVLGMHTICVSIILLWTKYN